jgi:acyl-coenzyme A synthetase/AMP-(fatty) acid ligase
MITRRTAFREEKEQVRGRARAMGLKKGDRVTISDAHQPAGNICFYAVNKLGARRARSIRSPRPRK